MDCASVREDMLDVLYGEAEPAVLRRVEAHQAECAVCREEYAALAQLRRSLRAWRVPDAAQRAGALRPRLSWLRGLAAAAGLLLALAGAVRLSGASLELRRGPVTLSFGPGSAAAWRAQLAAQDERHRREIETLRASLRTAVARGAGGPDEASLLEKLQGLMRESEERHTQSVDARFASFEARAEAQRRYDLARISAGLSYLDGKTGQHMARTTELMGYLLQASERK